MKHVYTLALSLVLCVVFTAFSEGEERFSNPVEITFRVVDENGKPVKAAAVDGYFWSPYTYDAVGDTFNLRTDEEGNCLVQGQGYSRIEGVVQADGYYRTKFDISLGHMNVARETGRWPLQETTVTLKGIRNPISMYAKRVHVEIPGQNQPIGFDMEKGDWVSPHGKGLVADVYINYSLRQQDLWTGDERLEMSNTNLLCGVQELNADMFSAFRSVYDAPLTGYVETLKYVLNRTKTTIIEEKKLSDSNYIVFRSRAAVDEDGRLECANYGKVYPPIRYGRQRGADSMVLIYYFNPTPNDRNLEFDLDRNLFKDISSREQVVEP